ncbi:Uncharacterised protein [Streptococcus pneumoniae]|nr:Uncharacterised protein [Streptococcus pneumoniae]CJB10027.1 Uncharacterised protein [Streptococcus pneumoniae]CKE99010.1 Uncharacterised protein [Streptococcus pneumoniae]
MFYARIARNLQQLLNVLKEQFVFYLIVVDAMNLIPPFDATTRVLHYLVYEKIHKLKILYKRLLIYELHQVQCEYLLVHLAILFSLESLSSQHRSVRSMLSQEEIVHLQHLPSG